MTGSGAARQPTKIGVVITEDHDLVRAGLKALLATMPGVQVIGEARNGEELLGCLDSSLRPEVALLDLEMPVLDGFATLQQVRLRHPSVRTLVLSMHDTPADIRRALDCGASGYLPKDAPPHELEHALRTIAAGGCHLGAASARSLLLPAAFEGDQLTQRQVQILAALAIGQNSKQIAYDLNLSAKTVDVDRCRIMQRLGIKDIAGLTRYAIRTGLVKIE